MAAPRVPPEKRPSVIRATWPSSCMPAMAEVGVSISRMPGTALGAFVAHDDHIAGFDFAVQNGGGGGVLGVEHPCRPLMAHHFGPHGGLLDHAAIGRQVAVEHRQPALAMVGALQRTDHLGILDAGIGDIFADALWPVTVMAVGSMCPPLASL